MYVHNFHTELTTCHLSDIIHWVATTTHHRCITFISRLLCGSHAAFPIRWAGSIECRLRWGAATLLAKCVNLILLALQLFFYMTQPVRLILFFNFFSFLSPLMASIGKFLPLDREIKGPRFRAFCASCSSFVFFITKGACELVVISIGNKSSLFNISMCFSDFFDW